MPECRECQKTLPPPQGRRGQRKSLFCSHVCGQAFTTRRRNRGAEIYDLFYRSRFDRSAADARKVRTAMGQLAIRWREEDGDRGPKCHEVGYMMEHLFERRDLVPSKNLHADPLTVRKNGVS